MELHERIDPLLTTVSAQQSTMGHSFREMLLISWVMINIWVTAGLIFLSVLFYVLWRWYIRRESSIRSDRWERFLYYGTNFWIQAIFFSVPIIFSTFVTLDYMNVWVSVILSFIVSLIGWVLVAPPCFFEIERDKYLPGKPTLTPIPTRDSTSDTSLSSSTPAIPTSSTSTSISPSTSTSPPSSAPSPSSNSSSSQLPKEKQSILTAPTFPFPPPPSIHQSLRSGSSPNVPVIASSSPLTLQRRNKGRDSLRTSSSSIPNNISLRRSGTHTTSPSPLRISISGAPLLETKPKTDEHEVNPPEKTESSGVPVSITIPDSDSEKFEKLKEILKKQKKKKVPRKERSSSWKHFLRKPIDRPVWFWLGVLACLIFAFVSNFFFEDICITSDPFEFSFKWDRLTFGESTCDHGAPCHVYLTFGEEMQKSMIVNFHTRQSLEDSLVLFDTESHQSLEDYRFSMRGMELMMDLEESRYVHWVELHGLKPNTKYYFVAGGYSTKKGKDGSRKKWFSSERWFMTAPSEESFVYVSGGDFGMESKKLLERAIEYDPLFIGLGGDLAYENGLKACYRRFDRWLKLYDKSSEKKGRMFPMLPSLGNHEGGFLLHHRNDLPFYFHYFPTTYGYVHPDERPSYHYHKFGRNTLLYVLDSGHLAPPAHQLGFLEKIGKEQRERKNRIAFYHVGLKPTANDDQIPYLRRLLRDSWKPAFEENGIRVAFQHHEHTYGRETRRGGKETLYITSGSVGAEPNPITKSQKGFETLRSTRNLMVVTVEPNVIKVDAVDVEGRVFDSFSTKEE